jgi:hypothetical protein
MWRQFLPYLKKNPPQNSVEAVPAKSQNESAPKFFGGSSRRISKRIRPKILWRQFPPNLKKKPPQNSVEAVPTESQKESAPKFCGGISRRISKKGQPKKNPPGNYCRQFPPNLKKNTPQNTVGAVPA